MTFKTILKCAVLAALLFVPVTIQADSEAWVEYSADTNTLTFRYDDQRSASEATATFSLPSADNKTPGWISHNETITKVVFDKSFATARPQNGFGKCFPLKA